MAGTDPWAAFPDADQPQDQWNAFPDVNPQAMPSRDIEQMSIDQGVNRPDPYDVPKSLATGLGEGAHMIPGMLGDVQELGYEAGKQGGVLDFSGWMRRQMGKPPLTAEQSAQIDQQLHVRAPTTAELEKATGFENMKHEPQTLGGEYARTIGQFIPAAAVAGLPGGVRSAMTSAVKYGVVPGAAAESAGQISKGFGPEFEPYARLLGALIGAGGAAILSRPGTAEQVLAGKLPKGLRAADIDQAARLINTGERMGVRLTWPEALKKATRGRVDLSPVQRVVEQTQGGQQVMAPYMAARPWQVQRAGGEAFNELTAGARMTEPVKAGLAIQKASAQSVDMVRRRINAITKPLYRAAETDMVDAGAFDQLSKNPIFADALAAVRELPEHSQYIAGLPDRSVGVFNEMKKYLGDIATGKSGKGPQAASVYRRAESGARQAAVRASPAYERALGEQAALRQNVLAPFEGGPVGKMAVTKDLTLQGRRLLPPNPTEESEGEVGRAVQQIVKQDKSAAFQLVRNNLRTQFNEATQANVGGPNAFGGAKFANAVRGNAQQAKNLEAAIRALPDGDARWNAFNSFLHVMETTGMRLPANSATAFNQAEQAALKNMGTAAKVATGARTFGRSVIDKWEEFMLGRNADTLAQIFTDPSPRTRMLLKSLAASKAPSRKAQISALLVYYLEASQKGAQPVGQQ